MPGKSLTRSTVFWYESYKNNGYLLRILQDNRLNLTRVSLTRFCKENPHYELKCAKILENALNLYKIPAFFYVNSGHVQPISYKILRKFLALYINGLLDDLLSTYAIRHEESFPFVPPPPA